MVTEALHTSQQRGELYEVAAANAFGTVSLILHLVERPC